MNPLNQLRENGAKSDKSNPVIDMCNKFIKSVSNLFEPEEVEVFVEKEEGKVVGYTYTKVVPKSVAQHP